ncbi:MAG TPA: hypothetical protein P5086_12685 [Prolixibacteraceae bacterium]|jgi:hypothetical protein|nr:hypothetical protein [Bacteroidales bacterium]HNQ36742.1 hypothetical protein [Prolixibacteraceae bacterium]HOY51267.1 hypothetical protein [Prolixibacteraceae bacterium]HPJ78623.1 hypothetical protein [Prolixibacteraceae bacterium]HRV90157.1 hypothetical protein [Prolixibacteraceae bacterium]
MFDKKAGEIKSPDLKKMQEVVIDLRTKIYIPYGEDPREARNRYLLKFATMKRF